MGDAQIWNRGTVGDGADLKESLACRGIMADKPPDEEDRAAASGGHGHAATPPLPTKGVRLSKKKGSLEDTLSTVTPPHTPQPFHIGSCAFDHCMTE